MSDPVPVSSPVPCPQAGTGAEPAADRRSRAFSRRGRGRGRRVYHGTDAGDGRVGGGRMSAAAALPAAGHCSTGRSSPRSEARVLSWSSGRAAHVVGRDQRIADERHRPGAIRRRPGRGGVHAVRLQPHLLGGQLELRLIGLDDHGLPVVVRSQWRRPTSRTARPWTRPSSRRSRNAPAARGRDRALAGSHVLTEACRRPPSRTPRDTSASSADRRWTPSS